MSHEDIIAELAADTVHTATSIGVAGSRFNCGNFSEIVCIELKVCCIFEMSQLLQIKAQFLVLCIIAIIAML